MADLTHNTALSHRNQEEENQCLLIDIRERQNVAMIDLRGKADDKSFMKNAAAVLGVELPTSPRSSAIIGDLTVLWLSIDQWLITLPLEKGEKLLADFNRKLKKNHHLVCNMSDARTIIRLTGDQVREVMIKGCSTDVTGPEYTSGKVRRMLFAEVAALCHFVDDNPDIIDLYVFRSYADYVWEWLLQTAHEDAGVRLFQSQEVPRV